ncbi:MAG: pyridoxamine 5'-phosphate oxidase family protein [Bacteroidota bacterium]
MNNGKNKDLNKEESVAKLRELAEGKTCMFCTFTKEYSIKARPMTALSIEDDGSIWFMSRAESDKNREISLNPKVELLFALGAVTYIKAEGSAEISRDQAMIDKLWSAYSEAWFERGKEDPAVTLIKIKLKEGYYWDSRHGVVVSALKMVYNAITGPGDDDGVEGKLEFRG